MGLLASMFANWDVICVKLLLFELPIGLGKLNRIGRCLEFFLFLRNYSWWVEDGERKKVGVQNAKEVKL